MNRQHNYEARITWTGNTGSGTKDYRSYTRDHIVSTGNKPDILCSSDPAFRGDNSRYNPEDLFIASLSSCHMLSYLHRCAVAGVVVLEYSDNVEGRMIETPDGGGHFTEVTLYPQVVVSHESMIDKANELHHKASDLCFIAKSCNFPVHHQPSCIVKMPEIKPI